MDTAPTADQQTFAALATAAPNSAPVVDAQPVGIPDAVTGVVTGTVIATDPDGNTLSYAVTGQPANGTATVNSATGAYTYTPTSAARLAAGITPAADTDTFTVNVSDGQSATAAPVSVYVSPTQLGATSATAVGSSPSGMAVSQDSSRTYVANAMSNTVSVIDTNPTSANYLQVISTITVGSSPSALAVSGNRLYVANTGSNTVSVIDTTTNKVIDTNPSASGVNPISVGSSPSALAVSGNRLYVANRASNTVSVIDTTTNKVIDTNPRAFGVNSISVGSSPSALAVSGSRLYVANTGSSTVSVIDTTTNKVIDTNPSAFGVNPISVGSSPSALAVSGNRLYAANTGSGSISVIDTTTNKVIDTNPGTPAIDAIKVGPSPSSVAISSDGSVAYVANGNDTVSVINTKTNTVLTSVAIDPIAPETSGGHVIAISPAGNIYISDAVDSQVRTLSLATVAADTAAPTVSLTGPAPNATVSGTVNLSATASDNVGVGGVQFQVDGVALGAEDTAAPYSTSWNTTTAADGAHTLSARARDAAGNTTTSSVTVTVANADTAAPTVSLTGPAPNATVSGTVNLSATASDNVGVGGVQFQVDGVALGAEDTAAPYSTSWNTTTAADGAHTLSARARDAAGNTTTSSVTVTVANNTTASTVSVIGSTTVTGDRPGSLVLSADGTRAVLITAYPIGSVTSTSYPDGTGGSTTRVAVIDTASGSQVGTTFTSTGTHAAVVKLSADGTRVLITSSAYDATGTRVAVLNTTTGTQIGTTVTLNGGGSAQFIANDTRALITASAYSPTTSTTTTRLAVLDTTTGTQIGTTLTLAGNGSAALSPDGTHALVTTESNVAVINTVTGTPTNVALTGPWVLEQWSADGSHALISSKLTDAAGTTTRVAVLDTTTGTQTGTTLTLTGYGSVQSSPTGTRALVTSVAGTTTRVAVFDTTAGTQIGTTLTLTGDSAVESGPDGTRVLITTDVYDSATASHTTRVTMFNTSTGTQTGTLSLTGSRYNNQPVLSPDGTRALITTTVYDSATTLHTSRVTMFDTATGTQIGTTLTLTGPEVAGTTWRADGSRALITMTPTQYDSVTSPTLVAVVDTAGSQVGTTLSLSGMPTYGALPVWSSDGTRVLITTNTYGSTTGYTTNATTINTTTGTQTGTTVTLASGQGGAQVSLNGNRVMIVAGDQVAVLNTITGNQIGSTVTITGTASAPVFSADGTRALITTNSNVTVIDTTTGTQLGTTLTLASSRPIVTMLTPDGAHALVTTARRYWGDAGIAATPVALIDLTTGTQTGSTLSLIGDTYASPAFTPDGTRALIATSADDVTTGISTTRVTTINTATGMPTGTTVTLSGALASGVNNPLRVVLSPNGTRAVVATNSTPSTYPGTSRVAIIDTATGTQIGDTVTINGALSGLRWSTDGTRVFVTTYITTATGADLSIQETVLKTS